MSIIRRQHLPVPKGQFLNKLEKLWKPHLTGDDKIAFHREAKRVLRALAQEMGLKDGTYEVRSNKGGPAVTGEITLHGEFIYVQIVGVPLHNGANVIYRSCSSTKDFTGGPNNWEMLTVFRNVKAFAIRLNKFNRRNV